MKVKSAVLLVLGTVLVTAMGIAFGYAFTSLNKDEEQEETKSYVAGASTNNSGGLAVGQSQPLGGLNSQTQNLDGSSQQQLPGPDQFYLYEEYANEQNSAYVDIEIGSGEEIVPGDTVAVYYAGWLSDGTLFDATRQDGNGELIPFEFTVGSGQVIPGWDQSIPGMKIGGTRRLIVPSSVGYGPQGQGDVIPPNALLIFEVTAVSKQASTQQQQNPPQREPGL